jgi:signal peptidase II
VRELQAAGGTALTLPSRRVGVLAGTAALVLAVDVVSKLIVVARLSDHDPIEVLGGLLTFRLTRNAGAAFGMAEGATVLFTAVAAVVVVVIARAARRLGSAGWAVSLGLILGGALGNLSDRLLRDPGPLRGRVVDWIELPHWPIFNLADSAIVCGAVLAVLLSMRGVGLDGRREDDAVA